MNHLPGFTAEASLGPSNRTYHGSYFYNARPGARYELVAAVWPSRWCGSEDSCDILGADPIDEAEAMATDVDELGVIGTGFEGAKVTGVMDDGVELDGIVEEEMVSGADDSDDEELAGEA